MAVNGGSRNLEIPDQVSKTELLFGNDQSLKTPIRDERPEGELFGNNGPGLRFASFAFGAPGIVYHNFAEGRKVAERESMGKTYLVTDSIRPAAWKLTGESRTILGYTCQKALLQSVVMSRRMSMTNGEMRPEEKPDSIRVVAWFSPAIPVPAGPEYQGQLPGLILELDIRDGMSVYKAVDISTTVSLSAIREPKKGTKITEEAFRKEMDERMKKMMERNGGMRQARPPM